MQSSCLPVSFMTLSRMETYSGTTGMAELACTSRPSPYGPRQAPSRMTGTACGHRNQIRRRFARPGHTLRTRQRSVRFAGPRRSPALGRRTTYTFDAVNQQTATKDALGNLWTSVYDAVADTLGLALGQLLYWRWRAGREG